MVEFLKDHISALTKTCWTAQLHMTDSYRWALLTVALCSLFTHLGTADDCADIEFSVKTSPRKASNTASAWLQNDQEAKWTHYHAVLNSLGSRMRAVFFYITLLASALWARALAFHWTAAAVQWNATCMTTWSANKVESRYTILHNRFFRLIHFFFFSR